MKSKGMGYSILSKLVFPSKELSLAIAFEKFDSYPFILRPSDEIALYLIAAATQKKLPLLFISRAFGRNKMSRLVRHRNHVGCYGLFRFCIGLSTKRTHRSSAY
ncbi:hypothetical protein PHOSAC3_120804 [Mesotoga infera]|nr:hypothetical protein PHOSAC3_120804 [Mesotoga infera]